MFHDLRIDHHAAFRRIAGASELHFAARRDHTFHGHLIAGERTGFVGADHRRGTERFHRMQLLDDRIMHGHALHTECKHYRKNRSQTFRHGRDRQRNGQQQRIDHIVNVVEAFGKRERDQHHDRDDAYRGAEDFGNVVHFLLQRGFVVFRGLQQIRDFADLRTHAGTGYDGSAGALRYGRAVEYHVGAVAEGFRLCEGVGLFADGHAFAGKAGFRDAQAGGREEASVRGDGVAFTEHDNVAGHHVNRVDAGDLAVTQHVGLRRGHVGESFDGRFRLRFLNVAEHRVDDEDEHDDDGVERQCFATFRTRYGVGPFDEPCDERNAGCSQQQVDKGVFELFEEFLPFRHRWCGREFIRSVLVESPLGFRLAQAGIQIDAKRLRYDLRIGERRINLLLRNGFRCLFEIVRTGIAELGGLIFLAINHDDLLGSAAE